VICAREDREGGPRAQGGLRGRSGVSVVRDRGAGGRIRVDLLLGGPLVLGEQREGQGKRPDLASVRG